MPSSDAFLEPGKPDALTPLRLAYCPGCALAQLLETPSREELFGETYLYLSSFSGAVAREAEANAASLIDRCRLGAASQVLEIACNDGYLLRHFAGRGIGVLGVEPSPVPAAAARNQGFEIVEQFFSLELATDLAGRGVRPDLVIANNVMAHVPDPGDLAAGIAHILSPEGTAVVEVHALSDLVEKLQFDTIYHEHASYFSATSIAALFARHGLVLTDLVHIPLQGGSLRLYFKQSGAPSRQVLDQMAREAASGIADGSALRTFAKRVEIAIAALKRCLTQRAAEGQSIIAYGAAAKGTMLLNHLALGPETIAYVVDQNPHKQGSFDARRQDSDRKPNTHVRQSPGRCARPAVELARGNPRLSSSAATTGRRDDHSAPPA